MAEPRTRVNKTLEKELDSRRRACLDETRTHIRCGDWRGPHGSEIHVIGTVAELHGTVCTCCVASPQADSSARQIEGAA